MGGHHGATGSDPHGPRDRRGHRRHQTIRRERLPQQARRPPPLLCRLLLHLLWLRSGPAPARSLRSGLRDRPGSLQIGDHSGGRGDQERPRGRPDDLRPPQLAEEAEERHGLPRDGGGQVLGPHFGRHSEGRGRCQRQEEERSDRLRLLCFLSLERNWEIGGESAEASIDPSWRGFPGAPRGASLLLLRKGEDEGVRPRKRTRSLAGVSLSPLTYKPINTTDLVVARPQYNCIYMAYHS